MLCMKKNYYYFYYYYLFQLNKVADKTESFQKKLSSFFNELAIFDKNLAEKDLAYSQSLYQRHVRDIVTVSDRIAENIATLFKLTIIGATNDVAEKVWRLGLEFWNAFNPLKGLSQGFKIITDVMDAMIEVAQASRVLAKLLKAFQTEKPNVDKIVVNIEESRKKNDEVLKNMTKILNGKEPMTVERAKTFLTEYFEWDKYGEKEQIVKLGGIQESLLETTCAAVDGMSSVIGSTIATVEAGICPFFLYTHFFCTRIYLYKKLRIGVNPAVS